MAKQLINKVQCRYCGQVFDVNTEDIEWERVNDLGENDQHAPLHDYGYIQKMKCPNPECGKDIMIVYTAVGDLSKGNVLSQGVTTI